MAISENSRVSFTVAALVSVVGACVAGGITWGMYSTRLEAVEADAKETRADVRKHETQLAEVRAQYEEIIRRLDKIDRRLEWSDRRRTP